MVLLLLNQAGRSPRGERGLKSLDKLATQIVRSRSPRGERGLKSEPHSERIFWAMGRSPRGERGLKFCLELVKLFVYTVALLAESVD